MNIATLKTEETEDQGPYFPCALFLSRNYETHQHQRRLPISNRHSHLSDTHVYTSPNVLLSLIIK